MACYNNQEMSIIGHNVPGCGPFVGPAYVARPAMCPVRTKLMVQYLA